MDIKRILVLEPHPYHSEVIPGIVYYFEKMGYEVDVYIRKEIINENVFVRYSFKGTVIAYEKDELDSILTSPLLEKYDYVFFSSMEHCESEPSRRVLDEIAVFPKTKKGVMGIYHNVNFIKEFNDSLLADGRLFCISSFQKKYSALNVLAPVWFGDINEKNQINHGKYQLCTIGASNYFPLLKRGYFKIKSRDRNKFFFTHIGTSHEKNTNVNSLKKIYRLVRGWFDYNYRIIENLRYLGRVDFGTLYSEVEKSDFLVSLIDPANKDQRHYIDVSTSGFKQLVIGFCKPCIIHQDVANTYELPEGSYIPYKNNIATALKKVLSISDTEYSEMVSKLKDYKEQVLEESYKTLLSVVNH